MKIRHILFPLLASALLAACGQQSEPAAAPAPTPEAAQTAPAAPTSETAPATDAAAPVADAPAESAAPNTNPVTAPQGPAPVLGTDYVEIENGQRFSSNDKIEVAEVFAYWCGHCAAFEPLVNAWKARLPADVNFVTVPVVFDPNDNFPRAFYAAEAMGTLAKTHDATFNAIHIERKLRPNADAASIAAFYGTLGVDQARFTSTMQSFAVNANLGRARQFVTRNGIEATPTIIVNGKYRVMASRSLEDLTRVTDHLVAMERAAQ